MLKSNLMPINKIGRNDQCPCGSGLKVKKCHGNRTDFKTLSLFLSDKNVYQLIKLISDKLIMKTRNFIFNQKNMGKSQLNEIDSDSDTVFSYDRYPALIKIIVENANKNVEYSSDNRLLKLCENFYLKDFASKKRDGDNKYPIWFSIMFQQSNNLVKGLMVNDFSRSREYLLIAKSIPELNLETEIQNKFNITVDSLFESLCIILCLVLAYEDYSDIFNGISKNHILKEDTRNNILKVLEILTCDKLVKAGKNGWAFNLGVLGLNCYKAMMGDAEYETIDNPHYPKESYEAFIARMIEQKKLKIEKVLDLK